MSSLKSILGISAYYHDSAACLVQDGQIVAAAQEERFTRKKHDSGFPYHAVEFCLGQGGLAIGDVDYLVFYDKPLIKFERLLETYLSYAPQGLRSFLTAMPVWIKEKLFLRNLLDQRRAGRRTRRRPAGGCMTIAPYSPCPNTGTIHPCTTHP